MKNIKNIAVAVALLAGVSTTAMAQEVTDYTSAHNFIGLQVGAQATLTHYNFGKLITPQYAIQAGRYFNDKVGARIHIMGYQNKGGFLASRYMDLPDNASYKFKACTADLDLLMNLTNIIDPTRTSHVFDWVFMTGFGVNYCWDFDEYNAINNSLTGAGGQYPTTCSSKHSSFNLRLGTQFNFNVTDNWQVGLEIQANDKNDVYNLKLNNKTDWQIAALVGVTYNFGYKKKSAPVAAPVTTTNDYDQAAAEAEAARAAAKKAAADEAARAEAAKRKAAEAAQTAQKVSKPVVKDEPLKETKYFQICESDPNNDAVLQKVVDWCNKYPSKSITISGYADKGTGTPAINMKYSQQRANKVAKALQQKGIAKNRMTVKAYGDTVQPFAENDANRCTIVVGE